MPCRNWTVEEKANIVMKLLVKRYFDCRRRVFKKGAEKTMRKAAVQELMIMTKKKRISSGKHLLFQLSYKFIFLYANTTTTRYQ